MNAWLIAATALTFGLIPCGVVVIRAPLMDKLAAFELAGTVSSTILLLLAIGFARPAFCDLALTSTLLAFPAGMLFVRFAEHWR